MRLAHLQQQVSELRESKGFNKDYLCYNKYVVMLHSHISGAAKACSTSKGNCASDLAAFVIHLADYPAMFPQWDDIWGGQSLEDFSTESTPSDLWDCYYRLHQLAAGLVGGRSDIILLYKMLQISRTIAQSQDIDLVRAIKERIDAYWQSA